MNHIFVPKFASSQRVVVQHIGYETPLVPKRPEVPLDHLHFSEGWLVGRSLILPLLNHLVELAVFGLG